MTTAFSHLNGHLAAATPAHRVDVQSWPSVPAPRAVQPQESGICVRNPAPNASQPFTPSTSVTVELKG